MGFGWLLLDLFSVNEVSQGGGDGAGPGHDVSSIRVFT